MVKLKTSVQRDVKMRGSATRVLFYVLPCETRYSCYICVPTRLQNCTGLLFSGTDLGGSNSKEILEAYLLYNLMQAIPQVSREFHVTIIYRVSCLVL